MTSRSDRGQTAIDFVIGMGVFFIAIAFVLAFVPSMFAPFYGMGAGDALVSDRSAAYLAENKLVEDPSTPGALDEDAVETFFDDCESATLSGELGVGTEHINVSILDRYGDPIHSDYICGDQPDGAETVSNRVVTVDGTQGTLRVVVW